MKRFDYEIIDSTNEEAKRKIIAGETGDFLLIAKEQTAGKGRKGRDFYSPKNTGLYMSYVHVGSERIEDTVSVTTATSVIVRNAIKNVYDKDCGIKWVNDLYYEGKKVCGILCECMLPDKETKLTGIIVGIGVNLSTVDFPEELSEKAGGLDCVNIKELRADLIDEICYKLETYFVNPRKYDYIGDYRKYSCALNKTVDISDATGVVTQGVVKGFSDEGYLLLEENDGSINVISSGEISLIIK